MLVRPKPYETVAKTATATWHKACSRACNNACNKARLTEPRECHQKITETQSDNTMKDAARHGGEHPAPIACDSWPGLSCTTGSPRRGWVRCVSGVSSSGITLGPDRGWAPSRFHCTWQPHCENQDNGNPLNNAYNQRQPSIKPYGAPNHTVSTTTGRPETSEYSTRTHPQSLQISLIDQAISWHRQALFDARVLGPLASLGVDGGKLDLRVKEYNAYAKVSTRGNFAPHPLFYSPPYILLLQDQNK